MGIWQDAANVRSDRFRGEFEGALCRALQLHVDFRFLLCRSISIGLPEHISCAQFSQTCTLAAMAAKLEPTFVAQLRRWSSIAPCENANVECVPKFCHVTPASFFD